MIVRIAAVQYLLRQIDGWDAFENQENGTTIPLYDKRIDIYENPVEIIDVGA